MAAEANREDFTKPRRDRFVLMVRAFSGPADFVKLPPRNAAQMPSRRLASPIAGKNRGFCFLPELLDEVLVAFEESDPAFFGRMATEGGSRNEDGFYCWRKPSRIRQ
jgi:hypothetical protein